MTQIINPISHQLGSGGNFQVRVGGFTPTRIGPIQWLFSSSTILSPSSSTISDYMGDERRTIHQGQAYSGNGISFISVPGVLTSDTITSVSTDTPVCTGNGILNIASGDTVYGVTVTRAGVTWAFYKCDEGAGEIAYDASGNENHGTITSADTGLFVTQDIISYRNNEGYSTSGSVYIPRDDSNPTYDVVGRELGHSGRVKYDALIVSSHGLSIYTTGIGILFTYNFGDSHTIRYQGTLSREPVILNKGLTFPGTGICYDIQVYNSTGGLVTNYPCSEGAGLTLHSAIGTKHGTITGGVEASLWDVRQNDYHWNIARGFSLFTGAGVSDLFVPYMFTGVNSYVVSTSYTLAAHCRAGCFHNGAESYVQQPAAPALIQGDTGFNFWFTGGTPIDRGYGDIVANVGSGDQIMSKVDLDRSSRIKSNFVFADSGVTGVNLLKLQSFLGIS